MALRSINPGATQTQPTFGAQSKNQVQAQPAIGFGQQQEKTQQTQPQVRFGVLPPDGAGGLGILGCILACCACCVGVIALPFIAGKKLFGGS